MSDPDAQDRVEHLKAAALDASMVLELAERHITSGAPPWVNDRLRDSAKALKRALDRFIGDTQPLDPRPPRDTGNS